MSLKEIYPDAVIEIIKISTQGDENLKQSLPEIGGKGVFTEELERELIDKEISNLIETQYKRAIDLLETNKEKLTELANVLLAKEVIFKDNLEVIFGKRPFEKSISEIVEDPKEDKQAPQAEQENGDLTS